MRLRVSAPVWVFLRVADRRHHPPSPPKPARKRTRGWAENPSTTTASMTGDLLIPGRSDRLTWPSPRRSPATSGPKGWASPAETRPHRAKRRRSPAIPPTDTKIRPRHPPDADPPGHFPAPPAGAQRPGQLARKFGPGTLPTPTRPGIFPHPGGRAAPWTTDERRRRTRPPWRQVVVIIGGSVQDPSITGC